MIAALLNHLWQPTLFAVVISLLKPRFRNTSVFPLQATMNRTIAVGALILVAISPALPQTMVSVSSGSPLAHLCYISALQSAKTGMSVRDGVTNCTAALNDPMSAEVRAATYDNRGVLYDAEKNYPSAWSDYNASIRINPQLGDAYLNRGVALIRLHKAIEALTDIQHGMSLGASLPQIGFYDLAVAEQNLGHTTAAYYNYKLSQAADPGYAPTDKALKDFSVTVIRKRARKNANADAAQDKAANSAVSDSLTNAGSTTASSSSDQSSASAPTVPPSMIVARPSAGTESTPHAGEAVTISSAPTSVESVTVWGYAENPKGDGDPDAITCRKPQQLPGSRLLGPPTCKPNGEWASLRKSGKDVTPDGRDIIDSEKARTINPQFCLSSPPPGANNANQMSFSPICF